MIGASKILTVSYGTFSCTLEGFDDPFNTMRAIAEYFRDLAAEDRYFGAEPPTPDAAMLHKIAEREIQRRVEAKVQENGVILRAAEGEASYAPTPVVTMPAVLAAPAVVRTMPTLSDAPPAMPGADSVAARLAKLREAQAEAAAAAPLVFEDDVILPEPVAEVLSEALPEPAVEALLEPAVDDLAEVLADPVAEDLPEAVAEAQPDFDTHAEDAFEADASEPSFVAEPALAEAADAPAALEDSIAAVLADVADEAPAQWPLVEDVAITEIDMADQDEGHAVDPAPQPVVDVIDSTDQEAEPAEAAVADDEALLSRLGDMIDPDGDDDDFEPLALAEAVETEAAEAEATEAGLAEALGFESLEAADEAVAEQPAQPEPEVAPVAAPGTLQRARARVIKIRRVQAAALTEAQPAPFQPDPAPVERASVLSPEAEAELQRELAALEAEVAPAAPPPVAEAPAPVEDPAPVAEAPQDAHKLGGSAPADDAVNRLISQTNTAMEGPENRRRLAAIAHLKAAVAATFADRKANPGANDQGPAQRMEPYRDDLDRVVRPRRPSLVAPAAEGSAPAPATERPVTERPAPLVLVSELRIDRPAAAAAPAAPVRPRRVTAGAAAAEPMMAADDEAAFDDTDADLGQISADDVGNIFAEGERMAFSDFAEHLGATTMPDLLEAAATYCSLVLGREQFTRPLLLQQIAHLPEPDRASREDCLRGFGTLLRDGRIHKVRRGMFCLSDQSRYLADAKRMAD